MAEIRKIQEGMTGAEVADLLDGNFRGLDSDIQKKSQENAVAVNTLYEVLQGVQSTLGTATTDIYGLKLWASETVPGTYATKEALKGYLALVGDAQTVKGTVYFDGAYFNNVPFADVGSKSVRLATMDDVPGFTPLLDEGVEIARVDIGGQQVFLYAPKAASVDLTNYYTKKEVEDYVGQEINTHKEEIAKVALTGSYNDLIDKPTIPSLDGYATEGWVNGRLGGYQTIITEANKLPYSLISGTPSLAAVATSGNYNDLAGRPAIPSVVDSLVSDAVADALSAKQGKVLNDAVGALRTALSLVENSYLDKTNPTVTGNMTVSGLLSAGSLSVGGRAIGMAAFYGVGNTVASGNYELITGGGVYTALQGYATTGALAGYLPTIGGTLTGALRVESMLTVTGVSEIAMLSCPKGLVVGDDQESGQAFKSFTNMFGWNGDGADLTEDWTWMIGKDGRATFGVLNAASLTMTDGGVEYAGVYHDDSWGVYLWNEAAKSGLGLTDDGIPHVNGLSVLYVGNYDLYLDGVYARKATTLAGYGITDALPLSGGQMDRNAGITWNNGYYDSDAVGSHLSVLADTVQDNSLAAQTGHSYNAVLNVGGGGIDSYRFQLASYATSDNFLFYRGYDANSNKWKNWVEIIHSGNISSQSVASAQSLTHSNGTLGATVADNGRVEVSGWGLLINKNSSSESIIGIAGYIGSAFDSDSMYISNAHGVVMSVGSSEKSIAVNSNGNVLIGTATDSGYKLYVNGDSYVNGALSVSGGIKMPYNDGDSTVLYTEGMSTILGYIPRVGSSTTKIVGTKVLVDSNLEVSGSLSVSGSTLATQSWVNSSSTPATLLGNLVNQNTGLTAGYINEFKADTINGGTPIHSGNIGSFIAEHIADADVYSAAYLRPVMGAYSPSSWNPKTSYKKVWGESFSHGDISSDTGNILYYLRASEYGSGTTELCVVIDGDYYAGTGQYKVIHEGNIGYYAISKNGGAVTGTLSIGSTRLNVGSTTLHGDVSLEYGALTLTHGTIGSSYWSITNDGEATVRTLSQTSDIAKKNVISDIRLSLGEMANAPLIKFTWADGLDSRLHVGTIAQYWDAALPEVVSVTKNDTLALSYGELGVAMGISLAKEVQELTEEVQRLRDENRALAQRLNNAGVA